MSNQGYTKPVKHMPLCWECPNSILIEDTGMTGKDLLTNGNRIESKDNMIVAKTFIGCKVCKLIHSYKDAETYCPIIGKQE